MSIKNLVRWKVKGIAVIPLLLMAVSTVSAAIIASQTITSTVTIQAISVNLYVFGTSTPYTSQDFGSLYSNALPVDGTHFSIKATAGGSQYLVMNSIQSFTVNTGIPSAALQIVAHRQSDGTQVAIAFSSSQPFFWTQTASGSGLWRISSDSQIYDYFFLRLDPSQAGGAGTYNFVVTVTAFDSTS